MTEKEIIKNEAAQRPDNYEEKRSLLLNKAIEKRKKSMLWKLRSGKQKPLSEVDVFGSVDSQSLAELINENKIEIIDGYVPMKVSNEIW